MQNLRILRVIPSLDDRIGGPAVAVRALTSALDSVGSIESRFVVTDASGEGFDSVSVKVVGPYSMGRYRRLLRDEMLRADVCVIHGVWSRLSVVAASEASRAKVPYVLYPHGMLDHYFFERDLRDRMVKPLFAKLEARMILAASAIVWTHSSEVEAAVLPSRFDQNNSRVLPYGVISPSPPMDEHVAETSAVAIDDVHPEDFVVLYIGRLHPKKGIDLLIEAAD